MASVLEAKVLTPQEINVGELDGYDLIGFGSGIYGAKHHESLLDLIDTLPPLKNKKAFIFSTSAILGKEKIAKDHEELRKKLRLKGYTIIDEFACKGYNTNSFLRYIGGMNRGRPNAKDLDNAKTFAQGLKD